MTAPTPLVIHPKRFIGGGPNMFGAPEAHQKNKKRMNRPKITKAIEIVRDLPPAKYTANIPTTIENRLNKSINMAMKKWYHSKSILSFHLLFYNILPVETYCIATFSTKDFFMYIFFHIINLPL